MNALLASRDVCIVLLTEWIRPAELRNLDTAVCNCGQRPQLLEVMKQDKFLIRQKASGKAIVLWILIRRICIQSLALPMVGSDWGDAILQAYLEIRGENITHLCWASFQWYVQTGDGIIHPTPAQLESISQLCPNLTSIDHLNVKSVTIASMKALRANCPKLNRISYYGIWDAVSLAGFFDGGYQSLLHLQIPSYPDMEKALVAIATNNRSLRSLTVDYLFYRSKGPTASNAVFAAIGKYCPDMEVLDLHFEDTINQALISLGEGCPKLKVAKFMYCQEINSVGLIALAAGCPLIEQLTLYKCCYITDEGIVAIATHCPRLQRIALNITYLTNVSYQALFDNCPELQAVAVGFGAANFPAVQALRDRGVVFNYL